MCLVSKAIAWAGYWLEDTTMRFWDRYLRVPILAFLRPWAIIVVGLALIPIYALFNDVRHYLHAAAIIAPVLAGVLYGKIHFRTKEELRDTGGPQQPDLTEPPSPPPAITGRSEARTAPDTLNPPLPPRFLELASVDGLIVLYACSRFLKSKNKKEKGHFHLKNLYGPRHVDRLAAYPHAYGFLIACRAAQFVWFTASRGEWSIVSVHSEIETNIRPKLEAAIEDLKGRKGINLTDVPDKIDAYFPLA